MSTRERAHSGPVQKVRFTRLKAILTRGLTHPSVGRALGTLFSDRIPAHGMRIDTRTGITDSVKARLFWGIYESAEIRFTRQFLGSDLDVVELGSSLGVVSCHIARKINGRRLVCVEANPALAESIKTNLRVNVPSANCEVLTAAIDCAPSSTGMAQLQVGATNLVSSLGPSSSPTVRVEAITLSEVLSRYGVCEYALVCDIEGAEHALFLYDREALKGCKCIIAELHSTTLCDRVVDVDEVVEMICHDCGFMLRARRGAVCAFERPGAEAHDRQTEH